MYMYACVYAEKLHTNTHIHIHIKTRNTFIYIDIHLRISKYEKNTCFSRKVVGNFRQLSDEMICFVGKWSEISDHFPTQISVFSVFQPSNMVFSLHILYTLITHEMLLLYQLIRIIIPSHTFVNAFGTYYLN